jgi:hypothetical protein
MHDKYKINKTTAAGHQTFKYFYYHQVVIHYLLRNISGSVSVPDSNQVSGSVFRRAKMTHKSRKN